MRWFPVTSTNTSINRIPLKTRFFELRLLTSERFALCVCSNSLDTRLRHLTYHVYFSRFATALWTVWTATNILRNVRIRSLHFRSCWVGRGSPTATIASLVSCTRQVPLGQSSTIRLAMQYTTYRWTTKRASCKRCRVVKWAEIVHIFAYLIFIQMIQCDKSTAAYYVVNKMTQWRLREGVDELHEVFRLLWFSRQHGNLRDNGYQWRTVCKNFENRLRFDKVTENFKVGPFLRHSVETTLCHLTRAVCSAYQNANKRM